MPDHLGPKGYLAGPLATRRRLARAEINEACEDEHGLGATMNVVQTMGEARGRNVVGGAKVSSRTWKTAKQPARMLNKTFKEKPSLAVRIANHGDKAFAE